MKLFKKVLISILVLSLFVSFVTPVESHANSEQKTGVIAWNVFVRKGPSSSCSKDGILSKGEIITGYERGAWFEFYRDGEKRYFAKRALNMDDDMIKARLNRDSVAVYRGPSYYYDQVGSIYSQYPYQLKRINDDWAMLIFNGREAFVETAYLDTDPVSVSYGRFEDGMTAFTGSLRSTILKRTTKQEGRKKIGTVKKGNSYSGIKYGSWAESTDQGRRVNFAAHFLNFDYFEEAGFIFPYRLEEISGKAKLSEEQMISYLDLVYPDAPEYVKEFPAIYLEEGEAEGIRGDIAFAQSLLETGNFKFPYSIMNIEDNNFCGLGVTGGGVKGNIFDSPRLGIRAQIQHLKAYANEEDLNNELIDQRFHYVSRGSSPYVQWLGMQENPQGYGWAGSPYYGDKIIDIFNRIILN